MPCAIAKQDVNYQFKDYEKKNQNKGFLHMSNYFILAQGQAGAVKTAAPVQAANTKTTTTTAVQNTNAADGAVKKAPQGGFGDMTSLGIMVIIIGAMFFLMWRGQSKERKKREQMLSSIKAGDRVVTIGGMYGTIAKVKEKTYLIDLSENVRIEVTKAAIGSVENAAAEGEADKK